MPDTLPIHANYKRAFKLRSGRYGAAVKVGKKTYYVGSHDSAKAASDAAAKLRATLIAKQPPKPAGPDPATGRRIFEARTAKGISLDRLCTLADIPRATLAKYERGTLAPNESTLARILAVLDAPENAAGVAAQIESDLDLKYRWDLANTRLRDLISEPAVPPELYAARLKTRLAVKAARREYRRATRRVSGLMSGAIGASA